MCIYMADSQKLFFKFFALWSYIWPPCGLKRGQTLGFQALTEKVFCQLTLHVCLLGGYSEIIWFTALWPYYWLLGMLIIGQIWGFQSLFGSRCNKYSSHRPMLVTSFRAVHADCDITDAMFTLVGPSSILNLYYSFRAWLLCQYSGLIVRYC